MRREAEMMQPHRQRLEDQAGAALAPEQHGAGAGDRLS